MTKSHLARAAVAGGATLATAWVLKKSYRVTGIYPPPPVFWFFIGFGAHFALELVSTKGQPKLLA